MDTWALDVFAKERFARSSTASRPWSFEKPKRRSVYVSAHA